jgi:sugar (pentulose or hexulose) kinase
VVAGAAISGDAAACRGTTGLEPGARHRLSGQMHGAVVLDDQFEVLRPAILWNDGRSGAQCGELERLVPQSRQITGNLAMPGFTAPNHSGFESMNRRYSKG